ncbi:MAG: SUMF1/EgtB/PvdO family nonheme iron enzyme [Polyangiaceae bacterium]|nr:SUMF1/EgtB/PvdO family nonheme iron enzyme [Polyangiaceae bacterium]
MLAHLAACQRESPAGPQPQPPASAAAAGASASAAAPPASAVASATPAPPPARTDGCAAGMVRVEGEYCPAVIQECLEHHPEYRANQDSRTVSERCLRFAEPTRCVSSERRHLAFCMDRYEWPNVEGELPRVLTSWLEARVLCERAGKRLCTEDEHNFACEGPEMLPHVYGHVRDATRCNIDKEYRQPDQSRQLPTYDKCLVTPACSEELARLDQRHRIGARLTCVSWAGVVDLNGNVNEWVELPGKKYPNRSGLKGGWWGPVRNRCRPTVTFHKEHDYGYEAGFRCCADTASAASAPAPSSSAASVPPPSPPASAP